MTSDYNRTFYWMILTRLILKFSFEANQLVKNRKEEYSM